MRQADLFALESAAAAFDSGPKDLGGGAAMRRRGQRHTALQSFVPDQILN